MELLKQESAQRPPLHGHKEQHARLRSRKCFIRITEPPTETPTAFTLRLWGQETSHLPMEPSEEITAGCHPRYPSWKFLNRIRRSVSKCGTNLVECGYCEDNNSTCGVPQDHYQLLTCSNLATTCTELDLKEANDNPIHVA